MIETKAKIQIVKKWLMIVAVFFIFIILVSIWLSSRGIPGSNGRWQDYSSDLLGFSLSLPSGWSVKEEAAESGPDILILNKNSSAFVRIRGFLDPYLNSPEAIKSSVAEYQKALALQEGVRVADFKTEEIKDDVGGFWLLGEFSVNSNTYRFFERGWLSMAGQALILRAADAPQGFDESLPAMKKIMDSFKLD